MNLSEMSKKELYRLAVELNVENRSKMTREELAAALTAAMSEQKVYSSTEQHKAEAAHAMPEKVRPAEYPIPNRYQIDTAVLLPINPRKEYVYWEVSDNTVNRFRTEHGSPDAAFVLKSSAAPARKTRKSLPVSAWAGTATGFLTFMCRRG
ncbi:MAG: Rho termination factor N-terminal domain-containing protein [Geovibrio sp.]|nr:Rho termination factor N-terminal domain-containing protein [Geovibrio sp.]